MKTLHYSIIVIFLGFIGLMSSYDNTAYGIWVSQSPQELLNESSTIFVGNITSMNPLQFEKQQTYTVEENGIDKTIVRNYTLNLDEYSVDVAEFLKNPQNTNKITVRQPTIGLPTGLGGLGGFKVGDRVLFYIKNLDGINEYSPESFVIPQSCIAKDVLTQKRVEGRNNFTVIQNGIKVDYSNFTANTPIQFIYDRDVDTLSGKSFDVSVYVTKDTGSTNNEIVFSKDIHAESKPCEWVVSTEWGFTLGEGKYRMAITVKDSNSTDSESYTDFLVKPNVIMSNYVSPLKQFKSGVAANDVKCGQGLQLIMKVRDESPACVKPDTAQKLIERGWTTENFSTNHPRATQMELKAYGFVCCGLDGDLLKGYLSTSNSFVSNATVQISTNGIIMGYAKTFSDGCFQFNQWNESKLAEQTDAFLENEKKWGVYKPFNLTFTAHFAGDKNYGSSTMQTASTMSLTAVPMAPPQLETTLTPTQVNLTQGSSTNFQIFIRPMVEQWNIPHLNLYLEGYPCETDFRLSQLSDNITASTTHPALFDGTTSASTDSPEGKYFVHIMQNGTNHFVANDIGTFPLNVIKMK